MTYINWYKNVNVTLDDEFHGKDFISHKQKFFDQFGTKIDIVPLSQTFKKIKNESRFFIQFWTDFVIDIILFLSEDQEKNRATFCALKILRQLQKTREILGLFAKFQFNI